MMDFLCFFDLGDSLVSELLDTCLFTYFVAKVNYFDELHLSPFVENGYKIDHLNKIIEDMNKNKRKSNKKDSKYTSWIPQVSCKLKKVFKAVGCQVAFKSPSNLNSILTTRNKPKLPNNSKPGVYYIPTGCHKGYTGETKKKTSSRVTEHEKAVFNDDAQNDALAAFKLAVQTFRSVSW